MKYINYKKKQRVSLGMSEKRKKTIPLAMLPENVRSSAFQPSPHGALPPPPRALAWSYPKNGVFENGGNHEFQY